MKKIMVAAALIFSSSQAFAYYSVMSTGDILPQGKYTLTPEAQFLTDPSGINVGAHVETGLDEGSGLRGDIGVGKTDFYLGGFYKFIPFPDIEGQPAVGFNAGAIYAADAGMSEFTIRFEPLASKKFATSFGALTPYGSVPIGLQHFTKGDDKNDVAFQLVGGVEIAVDQWKGLRLMPELGINLDNAPSYVSLGAVLDFDENGFDLSFE